MAVNSQTSSLPQGFSVFQPTLGSQLQFFPAVGTRELDELVNAYIPGPASAQEKRATISLDFFEYAHLTGQTFKFYPVYSMTASVESPATASPLQDSGYGSSFNASPVMSNWDWSQVNAAATSTSRRQSPKTASSQTASSRHHATDFSHIPGMKIMTKDGRDVTNSASRGSKTKEQRDHAHLMRIIKACDSCRRKKIRCDPSHKKRAAAQPASKAAKKAKAVAPEPRAAPVVSQDEFTASIAFPADQSFSATELDTLTASIPTACQPWEEFIQYPPVDDYDFFYDPEGYLSPQSSSSLSAYSTKPVTPTSQQDLLDPYAAGLAEAAVPGTSLPFDQIDSVHDYVDFNLFSPESSFSEDDRMVPIELSRQSVSQPRSPPPNPFPCAEPSGGLEGRGGELAGDLLDAQFAPGSSVPQRLWDGEMATGGTYRDPGAGQDYYSPSSSAPSSDVLSSNLSPLDETRSPSYYISDLQSSSEVTSPDVGNVAISHNRIIRSDIESGTLESVSTFANTSRPRRPGTYGPAQPDTIGLDETDARCYGIVEANNARATLSSVQLQSPVDADQLSSRHVAVTANAETSAAYGLTSTASASDIPAVLAASLHPRGEGVTTSAGGDSTLVRSSTCCDTTQQATTSADEHWDHWSRHVSSGDVSVVDANGRSPAALNSGSPNQQHRRRDVLQSVSSAPAGLEAAAVAAPTQLKSLTVQQTGSAVAAGDEVSRLPSVLCTVAAMSSGLASPSRESYLATMFPIVMMLVSFTAWSYMTSTRSVKSNGTRGKTTISSSEERHCLPTASNLVTSIRGMVETLQSKAITGTKSVGRMVSQSRSLITV